MPHPDNPYLTPEPAHATGDKAKPSKAAMAVILVVCLGFALLITPADPLSFYLTWGMLAILGLSSYWAGHAHGIRREDK